MILPRLFRLEKGEDYMPKNTPHLNIQLADPATDGSSTFNLETMLNDPIEILDEALGMVAISANVRAATTGNIVLSGVQTMDGVELAEGDRVLVKNQTTGSQNGIYTVNSGAWPRSVDADTTPKLAAGAAVYVEEGTANGKTRWQMSNTGAVMLETTAIIFEKVGGPGSATDAVLGTRTISDTAAPTGDSGNVTTLFGWLANMVKAITGGASWRTLPAMSLAAVKGILDAATNAATAGTLLKRDASGRAQVAAPSAAADIARKDTVEEAFAEHKLEANPHAQYLREDIAQGNTFWRVRGYAPSNLNDAVSPGTYYVDLSGSTTNKPINMGNYLILNVDAAPNNTFRQTLTEVLDSSKTWWRVRQGSGSWGPWQSYKTMGNITYYVHPDGNDSSPGTQAAAFKTIAKAISMIPQTLNHNVNIILAPGTYDEDIEIRGFTGKGRIDLFSIEDNIATATNYVARSLVIVGCSCFVSARCFSLTTTIKEAVQVSSCPHIYLVGLVSTSSASTFAGIIAHSSTLTLHKCVMSSKYTGFQAETSTMFVDQCSGSGFVAGSISSNRGSTVSVYISPTLIDKLATFAGGSIITYGSGVINPWGDNTTGARTYVHAIGGNNQVLQNLTDTKLQSIFGVAYVDHLGEYAPALARFAPKNAGLYLVIVNLYANLPSGTEFGAGVLVNNTQEISLGNMKTGASGSALLNGSAMVKMVAGDYLEIHAIQANSSALSQTIIGDMRYTYLNIVRIA
jgi:hypothetical protein